MTQLCSNGLKTGGSSTPTTCVTSLGIRIQLIVEILTTAQKMLNGASSLTGAERTTLEDVLRRCLYSDSSIAEIRVLLAIYRERGLDDAPAGVGLSVCQEFGVDAIS